MSNRILAFPPLFTMSHFMAYTEIFYPGAVVLDTLV